MILVSACLAGVACRYNGTSSCIPWIKALVEANKAVAICPEVLAGLPTPRKSIERSASGKLITAEGEDFTDICIRGVKLACTLAAQHHCSEAILMQRSPTCGVGLIYDGSFSGKLIPGYGLFAEALIESGIPVLSAEDFAARLVE